MTNALKYPHDETLETIYAALKARKLVKNQADFMRQFCPGRVRSVFHKPATTATLFRLWMQLNASGQHDLAVVAHKVLLASQPPTSPTSTLPTESVL